MSEKYLSITVEPERVIGHLLKAIAKGEKFTLSVSANKNDNPSAPEFTNATLGVGVWVKDSKL